MTAVDGRIRAASLALVAYVAGALLLTGAALGSLATHWPGTCCDQEQAIWFLGWTPYALTHGLDPFFTTAIGAPAGVNLMWNTSMPVLGVLGWLPARIGGPIFAYDVLLIGGIALSGWTAYLALRRYAGNGVGAFIGGAAYAFSPYVASHAAIHLNLANAWLPPLFLLVLDELLVRRTRPAWLPGIALGLLSVVQLLIAEEVLFTSVLTAGLLVLVMAASRRGEIRRSVRRVTIALATAAATFLVVGAWPLAAQFLGAQRIVARVQDPSHFSTDLLNLVLPTPYQLLAPKAATDVSRHFSSLYHEATAYLGLPLLVLLAVVAISRRNDPRIRIATFTGLVMLVLSLGPSLHVGATDTGLPLPWHVLGSLPMIEHVVPGRLTLFVWLAVAAVLSIVVGEATARGPGTARGLGASARSIVGVGVALVVILPAPLAVSTVEVPAFFQHWHDQGIGADETVLVAPWFTNGVQAAPMVWAAVAEYELRMPEAYAFMPQPGGGTSTSPPPTQLSNVMEAIQERHTTIVARGEVRAQIAADLQAAGIRHVIVGPMAARDSMVGFFSDLFSRPPEDVEGVAIWRDIDVSGVRPAAALP